MTDNFEGWRVTALMRPDYSFGHNRRLKDYVETQKHIDPTRPHGVVFHMGDERETFNKIFGDAIKEYNKGKRKEKSTLSMTINDTTVLFIFVVHIGDIWRTVTPITSFHLKSMLTHKLQK